MNSNQLTFRDAAIKDLQAIVDIYNSTVPGRMVTADTEPVTVEDKLVWFKDHSSDRRPLWVVECEGEICAWVSFQSFYGRPAYNGTAEISIYIAPNHRRQGLGKILIDRAIAEAPKLGIKTLLGFIFGHNEPSLKLFYGFGFSDWGNLPRVAELDGVERDLIIVGKRLV